MQVIDHSAFRFDAPSQEGYPQEMPAGANLTAHLLVPYVAAGAREVLDKGELSARSVWAIEDARAQLERQRAALTGDSYAGRSGIGPAALMATAGHETLDFSAMVLKQVVDKPVITSVEAREAEAAVALEELVADLDALLAADKSAAERTQATYDGIVSRLASVPVIDDIA